MKIATRTKVSILTSAVLLLMLIQLFPVNTKNPPVEADVPTTPEVKSVLRRACYDCHSNETQWPWYSRVAPVSWLVSRDVREGREALNFSTWNRYDAEHRIEILAESWEEVDEGEMPPWFYLPVHRDARLSADEESLLATWAFGRSRHSEPLDHADDD